MITVPNRYVECCLVPEQNQGLLLQIPYGDQGFQGVVGGVVGSFFGVNQAIHDRPEDQVVFEFLAIRVISRATRCSSCDTR